MTTTRNYATLQEEFWAGEFGTEYIGRNNDRQSPSLI